ncbi:MAG: hypothetical protein JWQ29_3022 [Phenylobacterium sp.]|nr:hypothetical protein [Phenylobacterium sp.]
MKVGWIGLGQMGEPMAVRVAASHELVGHLRTGARPRLAEAGVTFTGSVRDVAAQAEVLCVCVFDDAQLRGALLDDGALAAMRPGAVLAIHTTGAPEILDEIAAAAPAGVALLDAPFSGTAQDAARGGLALLVGGDASALEKARPVFASFADAITLVGPTGAGRRLKLINNLLFAAQMSLAAEALAAAQALGLDLHATVGALERCSGASYALAKFAGPDAPPALLDRIRPYLDKDADLARAALAAAGASIPTLRAAAAMWGAPQDHCARQPPPAQT